MLVPPERLVRWRENFESSHGPASEVLDGAEVVLTAADGALARLRAPFGPLVVPADVSPYDALVAHASEPRRFGLLLVRLGGFAVGVVAGDALDVSKVGARQVHGRSAAGGWSQQRFARRREGQVRVALHAAADQAARVLLPHVGSLVAVVAGGDRSAVDEVLTDPRLAPLAALRCEPLLTVPDPRKVVLEASIGAARSATVLITQ